MLPKILRLTTKDIESLSSGKSVFGTLISVRFLPSKTLKFSVSVSKKVAHEAVLRNKSRRRIYSILRPLVKDVSSSFFVMVLPKKESLSVSFDVLSKEVKNVLEKAHILSF